MLEKQMEELIAKFPEEFFPRKKLVLKDRQKSFAGVGRFDLLFEDEFQTEILMELKAVQARYEDATQLANYKDALEGRGEKNLMMWLVAPRIPKAVCEFLDRIGIEYSEIHEPEFRHVAARHGIALDAKPPAPVAPEPGPAEDGQIVAPPAGGMSFTRFDHSNVPYELRQDFDRGELARLLAGFQSVVKRQKDVSLANHLDKELLRREPPRIERRTLSQLAKWCKTGGIYSDGGDVARRISQLLFGCIIDREVLGA
jgi:hypothetical protein